MGQSHWNFMVTRIFGIRNHCLHTNKFSHFDTDRQTQWHNHATVSSCGKISCTLSTNFEDTAGPKPFPNTFVSLKNWGNGKIQALWRTFQEASEHPASTVLMIPWWAKTAGTPAWVSIVYVAEWEADDQSPHAAVPPTQYQHLYSTSYQHCHRQMTKLS